MAERENIPGCRRDDGSSAPHVLLLQAAGGLLLVHVCLKYVDWATRGVHDACLPPGAGQGGRGRGGSNEALTAGGEGYFAGIPAEWMAACGLRPPVYLPASPHYLRGVPELCYSLQGSCSDGRRESWLNAALSCPCRRHQRGDIFTGGGGGGASPLFQISCHIIYECWIQMIAAEILISPF